MSNMVVRTNVFSLNAHRNMKNVGLEQGRASNRLASGYRINSAADDAAGLAISETMRAQIRGLDQASRNAQDGQAMLQTTEGGLDEIGNMLQRVRELLVQGSNDTNTQAQRDMIDQEVNQLAQEISSMQQRVEFNTNRVLAMGPAMEAKITKAIGQLERDGMRVSTAFNALDSNRASVAEAREMLLAVGDGSVALGSLNARQQDVVNRALAAVSFSNPGAQLGGLGHTNELATAQALPSQINFGAGVVTATVASTTTHNVNQALEALDARDLALDNQVTALNNIRAQMGTLAATEFDNIVDFRNDNSTGNNVAFFQVGANANQGIQFDFENVSRAVSSAASTVRLASVLVANPDTGSGIGRGVEMSPLINRLQESLDDINRVRANLGAVQNRMDYTMRSLDISSENLQNSESRVRDADMAREMMRFTMSNVLQQASISMLSQANQLPNNLLQLLR